MKDFGNGSKQEIGCWANNRVENSHLVESAATAVRLSPW